MRKRTADASALITFLIIVALIFGEIRCLYKMVTCNWEPIGKAEIVYTLGAFTGTGAIIGWFNIEDK